MDLLGALKNKLPVNVGEAFGAANAVAGKVIGSVEKAVEGPAKAGILNARIGRDFPDTLPLTESAGMTKFVEAGLKALGHFKGFPDGKADGKTLEAVNRLREGEDPLLDLAQFGKGDLKLLVTKLGSSAAENQAAQNVLNQAPDTLKGLKADYPKPQAPAPQATPEPGMGGG